LARCLLRKALESESPPHFLYASNRAGRFNPFLQAGSDIVKIARGRPREVTSNPAVIAAYLGTRAAKAAAGHTPIELMGGPAT
jgi:Branched-chain amino acid ATP-binding cassette transporter